MKEKWVTVVCVRQEFYDSLSFIGTELCQKKPEDSLTPRRHFKSKVFQLWKHALVSGRNDPVWTTTPTHSVKIARLALHFLSPAFFPILTPLSCRVHRSPTHQKNHKQAFRLAKCGISQQNQNLSYCFCFCKIRKWNLKNEIKEIPALLFICIIILSAHGFIH